MYMKLNITSKRAATKGHIYIYYFSHYQRPDKKQMREKSILLWCGGEVQALMVREAEW